MIAVTPWYEVFVVETEVDVLSNRLAGRMDSLSSGNKNFFQWKKFCYHFFVKWNIVLLWRYFPYFWVVFLSVFNRTFQFHSFFNNFHDFLTMLVISTHVHVDKLIRCVRCRIWQQSKHCCFRLPLPRHTHYNNDNFCICFHSSCYIFCVHHQDSWQC